jgi:hypothetical protein
MALVQFYEEGAKRRNTVELAVHRRVSLDLVQLVDMEARLAKATGLFVQYDARLSGETVHCFRLEAQGNKRISEQLKGRVCDCLQRYVREAFRGQRAGSSKLE